MKGQTMSKLFPSADCNAASIAFVSKYVPQFAGAYAPTRRVGFHLIGNALVPYSFVQDVEYQLTYERLNCFKVTDVTELFSDTFLASLTTSELKVLGGCVLLLIEKGFVAFSLVDTKEAV
jgi:hypothetical protein